MGMFLVTVRRDHRNEHCLSPISKLSLKTLDEIYVIYNGFFLSKSLEREKEQKKKEKKAGENGEREKKEW